MRRINVTRTAIVVGVLSMFLVAVSSSTSHTDAASGPSLVISQVKITSSNGQFVTFYNTTDQALDMSKYQVEYFNNYDLSKATSSKLIALSGSVPPHGYYMLNDDSLLLCYQMAVDSASLDFSSTAGLIEVLGFDQVAPGALVAPNLQDYVGWSKTAAAGAQTLPSAAGAFLERQPVDAQNNPAVGAPGDGSWLAVQPDPANACGLVAVSNPSQPIQTGFAGQLLPGAEPAATIVNAASTGVSTPTIPAADLGLTAPSVTELLPNPAGTGNDGTDEFIELYNANAKSFDLSGFILQTGTTTLHTFTIPAGTNLPTHGFLALYSAKTKLSMSNSGGQAKLLDPFGRSVSASAAYDTAKDGQAWALANGKWYWTSQPTPGKANVIKQPASSKKSSSKKTSATAKNSGMKNTASTSGGQSGDESGSPVHLWTLAIVGGLALLYGAYEYRADLANHLHQFRRNLAARRGGRA
ncbi:MAG TPA: lamin tail domain-containing protein [Candidatus Saccharimonadales bacterium]|nr:lamin tail domain-containing protein [Candidatus Saccharimonadales bacterium]